MASNTFIQKYSTVMRVYDNGGKTIDRYTVIPPRWATQYRDANGSWDALAIDYDAWGVSMWCSAVPGKHLGKRVHWNELTPRVQSFIKSRFPEYCGE